MARRILFQIFLCGFIKASCIWKKWRKGKFTHRHH
ncbi:Protein CBG27494 [Caenorhabditis briggsae]|uniref:Protein CBG27494 n=1 Tax=Caenorhabditis briggsae TaxID=6238 RepID=B6IF09_CAEBR|nr:Protein CBG27494 [Caenorhabditis briggsae]CAR98489.1 Protein CBG27494 [Caenorhabditis briggsae]